MNYNRIGKLVRKTFSRIPETMEMPNLLDIQRRSYEDFLQKDVLPEDRKNQGLETAFQSVFPISDFNNVVTLEYVKYTLGESKYDIEECRQRDITFAAPMKVTIRMVIKEQDKEKGTVSTKIKDIKEQEVYFCELPLMTTKGTFIINGAERVIVSQLHRSPGVSFGDDEGKTHSSGKRLFSAKIIPYRGSWLEFEFDVNDILYVRIDKKRRLLATTFIRALGYSTTEDILGLFFEIEDVPVGKSAIGRISATDVINTKTGEIILEAGQKISKDDIVSFDEFKIKKFRSIIPPEGWDIEEHPILRTLEKDDFMSTDEAILEIYKKMRPGDPPTLDGAKNLINNFFFNIKKYDLAKVGRYKLNMKLNFDSKIDKRVLRKEDVVETLKYLIKLLKGETPKDDIDHLGNRRLRSAGELVENQFRLGLIRMEKSIREKLNIQEWEKMMPSYIVNPKPVATAIKEFFGSSQLSQFMDQTNPLAELTHKRRLSALGPGGLNRERAGFEVRDVHHTHYGRMCPIETPEGPNIGLIASLSTFARVNEYGFIETPYRNVIKGRVTDQVEYLSADREDEKVIAQANAPLDEKGTFKDPFISCRVKGNFPLITPSDIHYMDVIPKQVVSVATALIPFLEHDDANRALMGSNMQRQAVPLLRTEAPLIGTGMEFKVAYDSGVMILARRSGTIVSLEANKIIVLPDETKEGRNKNDKPDLDVYPLTKFRRSNQDTCINQIPIVKKGEHVNRGQVIADGPSTSHGELALGCNVLVAFMPWGGYNFEDAIIVSERVVEEDLFSSIHIEEFEVEARDIKLGKEEITRDIPHVGEEALKELDDNGVVRIGAEVTAGDILVGKVTPKGETTLTPEEKLLHAIFGEKAGDVKDTSLRIPPGVEGKVVDVKIFTRNDHGKGDRLKQKEQEQVKVLEKEYAQKIEMIRKNLNKLSKQKKDSDPQIQITKALELKKIEELSRERDRLIEKIKKGDELPPGVAKFVKVYIAKKRKLSVGDKMAGRHGNKGVVSVILPKEDMPFLPDGTPVDIILNPLGVPSRMNVGQILETHLGWAAQKTSVFMETPVFDGATEEQIKDELRHAGLPDNGKVSLYDGRSGKVFDQKVAVGYIYMMKLSHLVDDKIHARHIGPYSLVTQQPLGGKAQFGGQRFGEMEVWALEAYGAAHTLQELLTVKSDDVQGRTKIYEAIVKGKNAPEPGTPESFNVLVKELQGLCLSVELLKKGTPIKLEMHPKKKESVFFKGEEMTPGNRRKGA